MANGWNGNDPPAVVFTYAPPSRRMRAFACQATGRSGSHAMDILKDFNGILQVLSRQHALHAPATQ
jgi:hypothetical protein